MGTPDFAVHSLNMLIAHNHEIAAVFTQPDKPRGRGKKVTFSPVKTVAEQNNIPVEQPNTLKTQEAFECIKGYKPDCIAVAAYGMILPNSILTLPKNGCINVHASLLPKYRGAAPINRCIMNGETQSGVTIMQMSDGIDTGDMLLWESVQIGEDMTASELHDILAKTGGALLVKALDNIESLPRIKQDDSKATYAAMLTKAECEIDFNRPARDICNFVRGLADHPCAYTFYEGKRIKVYKAVVGRSADGICMSYNGDETKTVTLTDIQPEGGKRMKATEFLKGYRV